MAKKGKKAAVAGVTAAAVVLWESECGHIREAARMWKPYTKRRVFTGEILRWE